MSVPGERPASPRPSRSRRLLAALALTLLFFALIGTLVVLTSAPKPAEPTKHPAPPAQPIDRQRLLRPAPTAP